MDEYLAFFPYTDAALRYVESSPLTFTSLVAPGKFSDAVLHRSVERITWSILDNTEYIGHSERELRYPEAELFSYIMARIIVSCVHIPLLTQKYAAAEARHAIYVLNQAADEIQNDYFHRLLDDFQMDALEKNNAFCLDFSDVIKYTARLRGPQWRLVNLMNKGHVLLTKNELTQLLSEVVRLKVLSGLPLKLDLDKCEALKKYVSSVRQLASANLSDELNSDAVSLEACPPCIKALLSMVSSGRNLTHPARFALTSFLANIGMKAEDIVRIYEASPDFSEELTEYQVNHIMGSSGKDYTPPGCSTMETYGNCVESDNLCKRVSHPLSYYRIKTKRRESTPPRGKQRS